MIRPFDLFYCLPSHSVAGSKICVCQARLCTQSACSPPRRTSSI